MRGQRSGGNPSPGAPYSDQGETEVQDGTEEATKHLRYLFEHIPRDFLHLDTVLQYLHQNSTNYIFTSSTQWKMYDSKGQDIVQPNSMLRRIAYPSIIG